MSSRCCFVPISSALLFITESETGNFNCAEGKKYLRDLKERRRKELNMLASLTGKDAGDWDITLNDEENMNISADVSYSSLAQLSVDELKKTESNSNEKIILASAFILLCISAVKYKTNKK